MHHKGSRVYASHHGGGRTTRVFIAIDKSTAHGTYNNRSFGLAPSVFVRVCTSGWDYEFDAWQPVQQACFKITALAELNWMTYGLWSCIAYLNLLFFFSFEYPQLQRCFRSTRDNKHKKINLEKSNRKITSVELKHWCGKRGLSFYLLKWSPFFANTVIVHIFHKKFMLAVAKELNS